MIRKMGIAAFVCLAGLSLFAGYNYQSTLTVSGYAGSTTLSGFPVLVRIGAESIPGFSYDKLTDPDGGSDIRFLDNAGNVLPHEIDTWDKTGTSLVWVRLPELSGKTTSFRMEFGSGDAIVPVPSHDVWCDSNRGYYAGVWHMGETATAETAESVVSADSACHDGSVCMDGQPNGSFKSEMVNVAAMIGDGRINNTVSINSQGNYLRTADFSSMKIGSSFTVSGWFKPMGDFSKGQMTYFGTCINFFTSSDDGWMLWSANAYGYTLYKKNPTQNLQATLNPYLSNDAFTHVAMTVDGTTVRFYENGKPRGDPQTLDSPITDATRGFAIGSTAADGGGSYFSGIMDEVRLLSKPGSADWVKAEYDTVSSSSFVTAEPAIPIGGGAITVTAQPEELGTVDPAYGSVFLAPGQSQLFSAPDGAQVASDTLKFRFEGWALYEVDMTSGTQTLLDSAATNAYLCVGADSARRFVWNVRRLHPVTLSADRATNFTIDGQPAVDGVNWVPEGEAVFGAGSEDAAVASWSGDLGDADPTAAALTVHVTGPLTLMAKMRSIRFVAKTGSDEEGDGTRTQPWKTINHAILDSRTMAGDELHVGGGTYEEFVVNSASAGGKQGLAIRGGYAADWSRDLANAATVVRAPDATAPAFLADGIWTNVIDGVRFVGGLDGISCNGFGLCRLSKVMVTDVPQGAYGHGAAIRLAGNSSKFPSREAIVDNSLLTGNKNGLWDADDGGGNALDVYLVNVTVVANADNGVSGCYARLHFQNAIVAANTGMDVALNTASGYFQDSCFYGTAMRPCSFTETVDNTAWYWHSQLRYRSGALRMPPKLDADFRPTAASLTVKRGTAASAAKALAQEDLLGNPWDGKWDMGCYKSEFPIVDDVRYPDVYVAADGDDANTGSTPQDPVRSLTLGAFRTAVGGTCHVGPGTFDAPAVLDKDGQTLQGSGSKTVIVGDARRGDVCVAVAAKDVTVSGVRTQGGREGVSVAPESVAPGAKVVNCQLMSALFAGVRKSQEGEGGVSDPFYVSHCTITGCTYGVYCTAAKLIADNCLLTGNGLASPLDSAAVCTAASADWPVAYELVNCTIADNVRGIYSGRSYGSGLVKDRCAYNCILSGNEVGYDSTDGSGTYGRFYECLFDNTTDFAKTPEVNENPTFADPAFVGGSARPYRLSRNSPAVGAGRLLSEIPDLPAEAGTDLLGQPWKPGEQPNLGCYGLGYGLMMLVR